MSQTYSHRNGETEPPTVEGTYWFRGKIHHRDYAHDVAGLKVVSEHWRYEGHEHWLVESEECEDRLKDAEGQWWGPVEAPWQDAAKRTGGDDAVGAE